MLLVITLSNVTLAKDLDKKAGQISGDNVRIMTWFQYPEVSVLTVDFSTGKSMMEKYVFPKPLDQISDGEIVQGTLDKVKENNKRFPNTMIRDGYSITYKDKSGELKSTSIDGYNIVLTFDHNKKTIMRQRTFQNNASLGKNYTYEVFRGEYEGVYSIFDNRRLGYWDRRYSSSKYPSYYDKYSVPLTPLDYVISSGQQGALINIDQRGVVLPVKQINKGNDSYIVSVTNNIRVKVVKNDKQEFYYRIEGKAKTLLNNNHYVGSGIHFSRNKKYALLVEAIPPKGKWENPGKVILSFYDLENNKLIKSFQSPAKKYVSVINTEWYSDELARFSFNSNLKEYKDIFYLHLPTGLMTYQGSERDSIRDVPLEEVQHLSYYSGDTTKLITMQDPFYVTVDGEYVSYSGQGTFVYNDLVYIPVEDFCKTAGVKVNHERDKLILNKDSKIAIIDTKGNNVIKANGHIFVPAIDFIEKLGFKDKLGTYQKDLDIVSN